VNASRRSDALYEVGFGSMENSVVQTRRNAVFRACWPFSTMRKGMILGLDSLCDEDGRWRTAAECFKVPIGSCGGR
jgi:hypothetical protein